MRQQAQNLLLTYLYCIVRGTSQPSLAGMPRGVPAASRPHLLDAGPSTWLVAAAVPSSIYSQSALARRLRDLDWVSQCAVGHERVVEHFIGVNALVPMRLFTIFRTDASAVADLRRRPRMNRILKAVSGSTEWGVRLRRAEPRPRRRSARAVRSGVAYLREKQRQLARRESDRRESAELSDAVYRTAVRHARQIRRHALVVGEKDATSVLLDFACLVPVSRTIAFRRAMRALAGRAERAGLRLILTGPWPPYNFVGDAS